MTAVEDIQTGAAAARTPAVTSTPSAGGAPAGARMTTRAKLILAVLCAAQFAIALDFSILNIALPTLGRDLGIGEASLQWGVTAFALPSGGMLLLFGRLADLLGRKRLFLTGLSVFAAASLAATLAPNAAVFLGSRAVQGVGAAIVVPAGMALLTTSFAEGPQRDRALGVMGTIMSLGFTIGVVLGGVLTQTLGWRSTMALNAVMAVPVLVAAPRLLTESRNADRPRLDLPGAITVTGGLLAVIYALSTASQHGWSSPSVLGTLIAGVLLVVACFVIESRTRQPLIALRVLRLRTVAWGNLGGLVTFAMESALIFLCTLYLQQVRGLTALTSGLIFGALGLGAAFGGVIAPRLVGRFGARWALVGGLATQAVLNAPIVLIGLRGNGGVVLVLMMGTLAAVGHLGAVVSYGINATSGLDNRQQGLATGLVTTAQQIGLTLGVPVLSAIATARIGALKASGHSTTSATLGGIQLGLAVDVLVILATAVAIAFGLRGHGARR
jgi:MFS family permease